MEIFDTHAHYNDEMFAEDRDDLLKGLKEQGVTRVVNIGTDLATSRETVQLCRAYDFIYGVVGHHPTDALSMTEEDFQGVCDLTQEEKIVAIGEIGLDYYWTKEQELKDKQRFWFRKYLDLARELHMPISVHSREAAKDTLDIMQEMHAEQIGGVIHCYSYSLEQAKIYEKMGFFFGIGGVLTYKNAVKLKEVVDYLPLSAIVVETDCPYLSPVPLRGKRNNSANLRYVIEEIARIKNISPEEVAKITYENGRKLYRMED